MSIDSSDPKSFCHSTGSGQQIYGTENPSEYNNVSQDLDLPDPQGSQQQWRNYQIVSNSNDKVADHLQRLPSAEPEPSPWSPIHLNGVLPSESPQEQLQRVQSNLRNSKFAHPGSTIDSHANQTDEGYYTHSQPDLRSSYSGHSGEMRRTRPSQSSIPRSMPSISGHDLGTYSTTPYYDNMDYVVSPSTEQSRSHPVQQEPIPCTWRGCEDTFKTRSDLKYAIIHLDLSIS
jgi:hypothetical protein